MKVYLIKTDTMGSSTILKTAYLDEETCKLICREKDEEWVSHKSFEAEGEEISDNRVIVNGKVYDIDRTEHNSALAELVLRKLNPEEIDALKKYFSSNQQLGKV